MTVLFKKIYFFLILTLFIPALTYAESNNHEAKYEKKGAITHCINYLPENGKKYTINLNVTIDATKGNPKSSGELLITDDTQKPLRDIDEKEIAKFKHCLINDIL